MTLQGEGLRPHRAPRSSRPAQGAAYLGLRFLSALAALARPGAGARVLSAASPRGCRRSGLSWTPSDAGLDACCCRTARHAPAARRRDARAGVQALALRTGCRVIKALRVEAADDLAGVAGLRRASPTCCCSTPSRRGRRLAGRPRPAVRLAAAAGPGARPALGAGRRPDRRQSRGGSGSDPAPRSSTCRRASRLGPGSRTPIRLNAFSGGVAAAARGTPASVGA